MLVVHVAEHRIRHPRVDPLEHVLLVDRRVDAILAEHLNRDDGDFLGNRRRSVPAHLAELPSPHRDRIGARHAGGLQEAVRVQPQFELRALSVERGRGDRRIGAVDAPGDPIVDGEGLARLLLHRRPAGPAQRPISRTPDSGPACARTTRPSSGPPSSSCACSWRAARRAASRRSSRRGAAARRSRRSRCRVIVMHDAWSAPIAAAAAFRIGSGIDEPRRRIAAPRRSRPRPPRTRLPSTAFALRPPCPVSGAIINLRMPIEQAYVTELPWDPRAARDRRHHVRRRPLVPAFSGIRAASISRPARAPTSWRCPAASSR